MYSKQIIVAEGVYFTTMTLSLYIIQLITHLLTKEINNLTQNIDFIASAVVLQSL